MRGSLASIPDRPTPAPLGYTQREWDEHLHETRRVIFGQSDGPPPPIRFYRSDGLLECTLEYIEGEWQAVPPPEPLPPLYRDDPSRQGFVYFIAGEGGPVKIGWAVSPDDRRATLQCGSPVRLHILAVTEGSRKDERKYHKRFAANRLHGEWFKRTRALLNEIERLSVTSLYGE